jgi:hypothetical protein
MDTNDFIQFIDNDESLYTFVVENLTRDLDLGRSQDDADERENDVDTALYQLQKELEALFWQDLDGVEGWIWHALLAVLRAVDWDDIAEHFRGDATNLWNQLNP